MSPVQLSLSRLRSSFIGAVALAGSEWFTGPGVPLVAEFIGTKKCTISLL